MHSEALNPRREVCEGLIPTQVRDQWLMVGEWVKMHSN